MKTSIVLGWAASVASMALASGGAHAASHREAPITALDHKADITDFFAFVSYDDPTKVTMILDVDPLLEPSNGPNYFPFDPDILYEIKVDNDHDAVEDVTYQFRFETEIRLPDVFTSMVGAGNGILAPANSPPPVLPGSPVVPPAITALDGPGSQGLGVRQSYTVRLVRGPGRGDRTDLSGGRTLYAVPSNAGPRTMPSYEDFADQGIYDLGGGVRVFAGTVDDPFWIDLGAAFDSLNFRPGAFATGVPGVLDDAQDDDDRTNYAPDDVSGFNVNAISIEVPIISLTKDGRLHDAGDPLAAIGLWATTSRPRTTTRTVVPGRGGPRLATRNGGGDFVQIQRMGNPLVNELIIGTGSKDAFSLSLPRNDGQFADFALDPLLARVLNAIYDATVAPGVLPIPDPPRLDLLPLVQYVPPIAAPGTPPGPVADLLRLNTGVPPTPAGQRSRLGFLTLLDGDSANDDPAGFPNGRRVSDDVTDIAARAVAGILAGPEFNRFPHNRIGDGVNANDAPYRETFPYVGYAHSGRDSRHEDAGELGLCDPPVPTGAPSPVATSTPSPAPTAAPTAVPTAVPTSVPTAAPTAVPTSVPTSAPSAVPPSISASSTTVQIDHVRTGTNCPTSGPTIEVTASGPNEVLLTVSESLPFLDVVPTTVATLNLKALLETFFPCAGFVLGDNAGTFSIACTDVVTGLPCANQINVGATVTVTDPP